MRTVPFHALAAALVLPTSALATSPDISLVAIGLPFAPEAPRPVGPEHPLYHRVTVSEITDMPGAIRFKIAPAVRINSALRDTLEAMHMLAPTAGEAKVRLDARWLRSTDMNAAIRQGASQSRIAYTLTRLDNGQVLFDRTIETSVDGKGSHLDWGMGTFRAAVAVNFASAAACLDKAAYGRAPEDCALTPLYSVSVTQHIR